MSEQDGRFALTELGALLPAFAGALRARGEVYYRGAPLLGAVRSGGQCCSSASTARRSSRTSTRTWSHQAAFELPRWLGRAEQEAEAGLVAAYDFERSRSLVDVGGGRGVLLGAILRRTELDAVLVDRESAVEAARAFLGLAGVACVVGDFFEAVPAGADAYLLSRVLHDWDDEDALRILRVVPGGDGSRRALARG